MTFSEWYLKMKDGVSSTLNKVGAGADSASAKFATLQNNAKRLEGQFSAASNTGSALVSTLGKVAIAFGLTFAIGQVRNVGEEFLQTAIHAESYQRTLKLIEGDSVKGAVAFQYLKDTADKFGSSFDSISEGYKMIAASSRGTTLAGQATKDILEGITMASSSLGTGTEESKGALLAISQMISKGKVSAEELRGQLGERLPGAFQIAARAMKMSTGELDKLISTGNLASDVFLPRFAKQLKTEFAISAEEAGHSLQAIRNRTEDTLEYLKTKISNKLAPYFETMYEKMGKILSWIDTHGKDIKDFFMTAAVGVGALALGFGALSLQAKLSAWFIGTSKLAIIAHTLVTEGWTAAQLALNIALTENPIGVIIMAVAALAAGIYYAWQKSETFRGVVYGVWNVLKGFAKFAWSVFKNLPIIGQLILLIENFDKVKAAIGSLWGTIKPFFQWVYKAALFFIQPVIDMFGLLFKGLKWASDALGITDKVNGVVDKFKEGFAQGKSAPEDDDILKKLGIGSGNGTPAPGSPGKDPKLEDGINGITSGGKQIRNVNVNIGKLVEHLNINTTNLKEGAVDVKRIIEEYLLRAIQGSEIAMGNE